MAKILFSYEPDSALEDLLKDYGAGAGQKVQEVYKEFAEEYLKEQIIGSNVFPVSGRKFRGHNKGAKAAGVKIFNRTEINDLSLTVIAGGSRGYLIFPDEGRGVHNPRAQAFMMAGLESAAPEITQRIIAKLTE